jgi:hypothetical protein
MARWEERYWPRYEPPKTYQITVSVFAVPPETPLDPLAIPQLGERWYRQMISAIPTAESKTAVQLADNPARFSSLVSAKLKGLDRPAGVDAEIKVELRDARIGDPAGAKLNYQGALLDGVPVAVRFEQNRTLVAIVESAPQAWIVPGDEAEADQLGRRETIWKKRGPALQFVEPPLDRRIIPEVDYQEVPLREIAERLEREHRVQIDLSRLSDEQKQTPISLRLSEIPLLELMRYVTELARVKVRREGEAIRIVPLTEPGDFLVQSYRVYPGFADHPKNHNT